MVNAATFYNFMVLSQGSNVSYFFLNIIIIYFREKVPPSIFLLTVVIPQAPSWNSSLLRTHFCAIQPCFFLTLSRIAEGWCIGCDWKKKERNVTRTFLFTLFFTLRWFIPVVYLVQADQKFSTDKIMISNNITNSLT